MGNAFGVFKVGGAHVFFIVCFACKLCRRPIVQAAVWSLFVVIMAPDGDLPSGVKQVLKPTDPQTLFAQPPVKGSWPAHVLAMIAPLRQRRSVPRSSRLYAMSGRAVEKSITIRPPHISQRCGIRATHPITALGELRRMENSSALCRIFRPSPLS